MLIADGHVDTLEGFVVQGIPSLWSEVLPVDSWLFTALKLRGFELVGSDAVDEVLNPGAALVEVPLTHILCLKVTVAAIVVNTRPGHAKELGVVATVGEPDDSILPLMSLAPLRVALCWLVFRKVPGVHDGEAVRVLPGAGVDLALVATTLAANGTCWFESSTVEVNGFVSA